MKTNLKHALPPPVCPQFARFVAQPKLQAADISWHQSSAGSAVRQHLLGQRPATLWLTGLSGAGKSSIACALEVALLAHDHCCVVLDGDNLRHHLNSDLGFSAHDRQENIRRAAEVAHLMNQAGLIVITAFISPFAQDRAMARAIIGPQAFIEVHISTATEICEARDPKGLYAKARSGEIAEFTGISSPYQTPLNPELCINAGQLSVAAASQLLYDYLRDRGILEK